MVEVSKQQSFIFKVIILLNTCHNSLGIYMLLHLESDAVFCLCYFKLLAISYFLTFISCNLWTKSLNLFSRFTATVVLWHFIGHSVAISFESEPLLSCLEFELKTLRCPIFFAQFWVNVLDLFGYVKWSLLTCITFFELDQKQM